MVLVVPKNFLTCTKSMEQKNAAATGVNKAMCAWSDENTAVDPFRLSVIMMAVVS